MKRWLHTLQQKPKHVRNSYATAGAVLMTTLIVGVYFATDAYNPTSRTFAESTQVTATQDSKSALGSFFDGIKEQAAAAIGALQVATSTDETASSTPARVVAPEDILRQGDVKQPENTPEARISEIEALYGIKASSTATTTVPSAPSSRSSAQPKAILIATTTSQQ